MKTTFIAIALSFGMLPSMVMAEPKFVSNINGSSFVINASNIGAQAYECVYNYSYNRVQGTVANQFTGKFYIEAGVNNISVISRNTDRIISTLDFDYKCTEK